MKTKQTGTMSHTMTGTYTQEQVRRMVIAFMTKHNGGKPAKDPRKFASFAETIFQKYRHNDRIVREIRAIFKAIDDIGE